MRTSPLVGRGHPRDGGIPDAHLDAPVDPPRDLGLDMGTTPVPCEADRECRGGTVCRAPAALVPADLSRLALFCEPRTPLAAADGDECGGRDSTQCGRGLCVIAGTCVVPCISIADCAAGERCATVYVRTDPTSLQPVRACTQIVEAPPGVSRTIDFDAATSPGGAGPFTVDLGHRATTTLALFTTHTGEPLFLQSLRDAAGAAVFDATLVAPGLPSQSNPVNPFGVGLTVLLPSGVGTAPGVYGAELMTDSPTAIDRVVLERSDSGTVLDLDLYFVAGRFVGSADAPITPELRRAIDAFTAFYGSIGIRVGAIRTHELVGGLARGYATLEMDADGAIPETDTLFALTAGARGPSVSWFFVRDAEGVLGVSGGVPGAQCLPGTAASGIAISGDIFGSGVALETVLIHETGHFLGLFHTSEVDGSVLDPFADTLSCGPDHDANGDGFLDPAECAGAGADNVMFWAAMDPRVFSASQRALVARALLLH